MLHRGHQPHVDKRAGPQPALLIGENRLQADGARGGIGLVVDQKKLAGIELRLAVLAEGDGLQRPLRERVLHIRDVSHRQGENDADRRTWVTTTTPVVEEAAPLFGWMMFPTSSRRIP